MRRGFAKLLSALIVITLLGMCVPVLTPVSDAYDKEGDYGNETGFSYEQVDKIIKELTGKTTQELVQGLSLIFPGYTFDLIPSLEAKTAIERNTMVSDEDYYIHDVIDAYAEAVLMFNSDGPYPEVGDYWMEGEESVWEFLSRVLFSGTAQQEKRHISLNYLVAAYIDSDIDTHINTETGELTSVDISMRVFVTLYEDSNLRIDPYYNDNGDMIGANISYDEYESYSNIYLSTSMHIDVSGFKVISDEPEWTCSPTAMLSFETLSVSSDVADGLLKEIISSVGEDNPKLAIPELLVKIIKGASRMVDIFETMKSLTDMKFPAIELVADVTVRNYVDEYGYKYAWASLIDSKGEEKNLLISFGPYVLDIALFIDLVPSEILTDGQKLLIVAALAMVGLLKFNVADISGDPATQEKIASVDNHVDTMIKYDEEPKFSIPEVYIYAAVVGFIALLGVGILYWRRVI